MSYALSAYLVSQGQILQFPGCDDSRLLRRSLKAAKRRLRELDVELGDEDDEDDITHEQAFRELFSGQMTSPGYGHRYGWAFETLCAYLGEPLSNEAFSPCNGDWYEELDEFLAASNVALKLSNLVENCPISIPMSDDWPMIGHLSQGEIRSTAQQISQLAASTSDSEFGDALTTVSAWFQRASKDNDLIIVGFHG